MLHMMFARGQEPHTVEVGALECASLHQCDHEDGAGAAGGPKCQAIHLTRPLDYGVNRAATMLRGGSCQEHLAENIGSGADKEGNQ